MNSVPPRRSLIVLLRLALVIGAVALFGDTVPTQSPAPTQYGVRDLGTLGGSTSESSGLSEFAYSIVGRARTATGQYHAFADTLEGRHDLGTLGGAESRAWGTSSSLIVGQAQTSTGQHHAFQTRVFGGAAPVMQDLGTLGGDFSAAYAADQDVVGTSRAAGSTRLQAFIYNQSTGIMSALPVNLGGDSVAKGIKFNQVVGYRCTAGNASCRAFSVQDGVVTNLGSLGGNSEANALNYNGQIVGSSALTTSTVRHAFLYELGVMRDLGTLGGTNSEAFGVNDRGEVVGTSQIAGGASRAFIWRNGVMTDLNTLIPSGSGWILTSARGISEGGQIAGTGTLNGVTRGFLLTPPADLSVIAGGVRTLSESNRPRGAEVGRSITFNTSIEGRPDPITLYGTRLTTTLTGPADYISINRIDVAADECTLTAKVITCDVPPIDTITIGREYRIVARSTGPGDITHRAVVSMDSPDTNASNNAVTEENWAVAVTSLALTPSSLAGGKASSVRVTLTDVAGPNGAVVRLASSRPDIVPVPSSIILSSGQTTRATNVVPRVVSAPTAVEISASYGLVTVRRTLTVLPPALLQLYLTPTTVIGGCGTSGGKVVLTGNAPAGGAVISMTDTNPAASVPAVTVAEGTSSKTFTVTTSRVTTNRVGTVTASYGGVSQTLNLTVRPLRVQTVTLTPNPVTGGATVSGTLTLECAAPAGGSVVTLTTTNSAVAAPTTSTITIPAGATTGTFSVRTSRVTATTSPTIYATVYGVRRGTVLTVRP